MIAYKSVADKSRIRECRHASASRRDLSVMEPFPRRPLVFIRIRKRNAFIMQRLVEQFTHLLRMEGHAKSLSRQTILMSTTLTTFVRSFERRDNSRYFGGPTNEMDDPVKHRRAMHAQSVTGRNLSGRTRTGVYERSSSSWPRGEKERTQKT